MDTQADQDLLMRPRAAAAGFDIEAIRADFPILRKEVYGRPLVYLDNAATSQKPSAVLDRLQAYYTEENSNIHRGVHFLSQRATDEYEAARGTVAQFINAPSPAEVVFTRGTTEGINLVAATYGRKNLQAGDEVLVSAMEHHSNIVPWQLLCEEKGIRLRVAPINEKGELDYEAFRSLLNERTKIVAICHISNALGTINPVRQIIEDAHAHGAVAVIDGAQAVPHMKVDVQALDCDFYCFSGHKMFGPTGIGILYGKRALLEAMPPYQGGGDMIEQVTFERTTYNVIPHKFEAGTPNIAGTIGLAAAVEYLQGIGLDRIADYEHRLLAYATERVQEIEDLRIIGTAAQKASVLSLQMDGVHPYDAGTILDRLGIAVRTGHHCTQPLMQCLGIPGTVRASFAFYNTTDEVDALIEGLQKVKTLFA
jgi:cysteine desulfurase / selenocysteine lyase